MKTYRQNSACFFHNLHNRDRQQQEPVHFETKDNHLFDGLDGNEGLWGGVADTAHN